VLGEDVTEEPGLTFEAFFEAERARLLRALYVLTGNAQEAEEILQDAFLALWERWDQVEGMDEPVGYLYRTAWNRHRSRLRRVARATRRVVGMAEGADLFAAADERDAIARALATLSPRRREAVVLVELLGYDSASAGRVMGVADVTVRRLASEARQHLRTQLEDSDDG
jgi:RNA polymerase sigma factor (sigma-70 family)